MPVNNSNNNNTYRYNDYKTCIICASYCVRSKTIIYIYLFYYYYYDGSRTCAAHGYFGYYNNTITVLLLLSLVTIQHYYNTFTTTLYSCSFPPARPSWRRPKGAMTAGARDRARLLYNIMYNNTKWYYTEWFTGYEPPPFLKPLIV